MRACPFCKSGEIRTIEVEDSWTETKNFRVVCEICDAMSPVGKDKAQAQRLWDGALLSDKAFDRHLKEIRERKARLREEAVGGVSAPMATVNNTTGMGNVTTGNPGELGSGDNFGAINKKPYTQSASSKRKKKKKKTNESFEKEPYTPASLKTNDIKEKIKFWKNQLIKTKEAYQEIIKYGHTPASKEYLENIKYYERAIMWGEERMNENNINPYDKIGIAMAKKLNVKMPLKKKEEKEDPENQNAIEMEQFEHQIISLEEFTQLINEGAKGTNLEDWDEAYDNTKTFEIETSYNREWLQACKTCNDIVKLLPIENGRRQVLGNVYQSIMKCSQCGKLVIFDEYKWDILQSYLNNGGKIRK